MPALPSRPDAPSKLRRALGTAGVTLNALLAVGVAALFLTLLGPANTGHSDPPDSHHVPTKPLVNHRDVGTKPRFRASRGETGLRRRLPTRPTVASESRTFAAPAHLLSAPRATRDGFRELRDAAAFGPGARAGARGRGRLLSSFDGRGCAIALATGCRVITVSSGGFMTILGWLRTSSAVTGISLSCCLRM